MNTAATSRASSLGINDTSGSAVSPVELSNECSSATQGLTTSSVLARFAGNSQRCSTENGRGKALSISGSPISSHASRRAVWKGVSDSVSARPGLFVIIMFYSILSFLSFLSSSVLAIRCDTRARGCTNLVLWLSVLPGFGFLSFFLCLLFFWNIGCFLLALLLLLVFPGKASHSLGVFSIWGMQQCRSCDLVLMLSPVAKSRVCKRN